MSQNKEIYQSKNLTENQDQESGSLLRRILVISVPILIVAGFFFLGWLINALQPDPEQEERQPPMTAVHATTAAAEDLQLTIPAQGETQPQTEITLVPEVSGKIVYVDPAFNDGGAFKKGDVLLRVDPSDYNVAVIRAEAEVALARQTLVQEEAEAEIAKRDWEELGTGPASPLTLREPQMKRAQANLASAQAALENAQLQLSRTYIRAPFDGRIRTKRADLGQYVTPGTPLADLFSTATMEVRLPLSDDDLRILSLPIAFVEDNPEESLKVWLNAVIGGQVQTWEGRITRTDSSYDPQTRVISAIVEVVDPYGEGRSDHNVPLPPGLFVNAEIEGETYSSVYVIPRGGLRANNEVFLIAENNDLVIRDVTVIDSNSQRAIIASGLKDGDRVITSGIQRITPGMKVRAIGDQIPGEDTEDESSDEETGSEAAQTVSDSNSTSND